MQRDRNGEPEVPSKGKKGTSLGMPRDQGGGFGYRTGELGELCMATPAFVGQMGEALTTCSHIRYHAAVELVDQVACE